MEDAVQRVNQLRDCTRSLINAIDARVITDVTRDYIDDALGLNYARLNGNKLRKALRVRTVPAAAHKYVREIYADLERFSERVYLSAFLARAGRSGGIATRQLA
jgi:hypothetical protein